MLKSGLMVRREGAGESGVEIPRRGKDGKSEGGPLVRDGGRPE